MAAIQVANSGAVRLLEQILNGGSLSDPIAVRLFANNLTPTPATALGDFTESTAAGYVMQTFGLSGWTASTSPSGTTTATHANVVWTITGPGSFYGYYIADDAGVLLWSQRFDSTITFGDLGGVITLTPTLTLVSPIT